MAFKSSHPTFELFVFVLGVFLLAVWQARLPREGGNPQEKIGVTAHTQNYQKRSDGIEQIGRQHRPEYIALNAKWDFCVRMEGAPNVSPLAL